MVVATGVFMSRKRCMDEFKLEAARQVLDRGRGVEEVSTALGVGRDSLYAWVRQHRQGAPARTVTVDQASEIRGLQAELRRVTRERDFLRDAAATFARGSSSGPR